MGMNGLVTHGKVSASFWGILVTVILNARNLSCSKIFLFLFCGQSGLTGWMG